MGETFEVLIDTLIGNAFRLGQEGRGYAMPELAPTRQAALDYVKRLEARQITPEMIALWDEYQAMQAKAEQTGTIVYPDEQARYARLLWGIFARVMEGEE